MLKNILFVGMYPDNVNTYRNVFFRNLIYAIADTGVKCTVISPVPVTKYRFKTNKIPHHKRDISPRGSGIEVFYPRYLSFSSKKIGKWNTGQLSQREFDRAVLQQISKLSDKFDATYGHFFLGGGLAAIKVGRKLGIPSFVAYGECNYETEVVNLFRELKDTDILGLNGIIAVSSNNASVLHANKIFRDIPIIVAPNAVDTSLFYVQDKKECREQFCLPQDKFIVGFVGGFVERKGDKRLLDAVNKLDEVYVAFAGKGEPKPVGDKVLFCEALEHDDIPRFLNAVDVFCLPTQNEGSCNAIVEAAFCGLPVISSDLPFNNDLLTNTNSIRINPNSVKDIREAILTLYKNPILRKQLSENIREDAKQFTIEQRCDNILEFISAIIDNCLNTYDK